MPPASSAALRPGNNLYCGGPWKLLRQRFPPGVWISHAQLWICFKIVTYHWALLHPAQLMGTARNHLKYRVNNKFALYAIRVVSGMEQVLENFLTKVDKCHETQRRNLSLACRGVCIYYGDAVFRIPIKKAGASPGFEKEAHMAECARLSSENLCGNNGASRPVIPGHSSTRFLWKTPLVPSP